MEADLIVDIDDTQPDLGEIVQPESLPELEFPEIEVDAWIDLEDTWEKDYYFTVFTDDELYHHMYALYYHVLKDETVAQHLAHQQVASLKATIERMKDRREKIPAHLVPLFRGMRMDLGNDYGAYKAFHARLSKMPYSEAQPLMERAYLNTLKALNALEPYLQFHERRELELFTDAKPEGTETKEESESMEGGAPKRKKATKAVQPEPETDRAPAYNRIVYLPTDETPLPIDGVLQCDRMPAEAIPELYLKERVEYPVPTLQERIGLDGLDWKKPSSLARALRETTQFPFEARALESLDELTSMHDLQVKLATYGFQYDQLSRAHYTALTEHLENLARRVKQSTHGRTRYIWEATPITGWKPSERSPFVVLQPWAESNATLTDKQRAYYQQKLALLEKHSESFSKHPGMSADIYDLAVRIRHQQIDIEEAIATLQSMYQETKQQTYVDFLRDLLSAEWNPADLNEAIAAWNRMDTSVEIARGSMLHHYEPDHTFQVGADGATRPAYALEDTLRQDDTVIEANEDDDAREVEANSDESLDVFEPPELQELDIPEDLDASHKTTAGQREVWMYVRRMLMELHQTTELPLPEESLTTFVYQYFPALMQRLSITEQLVRAFPEIPEADVKTLVEQRLFLGAAEDEAAVRKAYKEAYADLKKTVVETFLYALTWWVIYLQDYSIRQGRPFSPTYTPCLSVWAFYGTPMSSSDEKGIARYLVCVALALLENDPDHSAWSVLRGLPEKKMLDRIYKYSQLPEYTDAVQFLKQQWKERWKEIARKEKDAEVRLEALEKATENPKEYLKLYIHLMLHLPVLLAKSASHKKQAMVAPVANSCCFQSLNQHFQPFADFKEAGLFTHRMAMGRPTTNPSSHIGRTGELGRVQLFDPLQPSVNSMTFYKNLQCHDTYRLPNTGNTLPVRAMQGVSKSQWNALCGLLDEPDWKLLPAATETDYVGETSTSHIKRAIQTLEARLTAASSKNNITRWNAWINENGSWEEKKRLLVFLRATMKDESVLHPWAADALTSAMAALDEWNQHLAGWTLGEAPDAPMELINYVLHRALLMPDTDIVHPKQLQTLRANRFERAMIRIIKKEIPSQRAIQDYYANVREKLKVSNLEAYKSKTIQEIQELQDAKRLKLNTLVAKPLADTPESTDDANEAEGLAEHRVYASWNADEMNPDTLDP